MGNGAVDDQDLSVLMAHYGEEVHDPTLMAHWPLDEVEGQVTLNTVRQREGALKGGPVWRPDAGMIAGALELDGIDDCIDTKFTIDPSKHLFSLFAWVKGGAPGAVIISQDRNSNWLEVDPQDGCLQTHIRAEGRYSDLTSQAVITDGDWHRVGLTWDGTHRILYVDDMEVARDTKTAIKSANAKLIIGRDKDEEAGTFWSGLIDDIRMYNRAVTP